MFPIKPVNFEVKCPDLLCSSIFKLHQLARKVFRKCFGYFLENETFKKLKIVIFD